MKAQSLIKRSVIALSLVLVTLGGVQCGANLFSVAEDAQLGREVDEQIKSNPQEYPLLRDATVKSYVQSMINDILRSPEVLYRGKFPYRVEVIQDDKTLNAFCTPGGYIYVYTGLMKFLDNEASLAGVLGHEIAHAERRHSTKRITQAYGLQILLNVALGKDPDRAASIGANLFSGLALLHNGREDEMEADEYSFRYLKSSRWYAGGAMFFFQKISEGRKSGGSFERLLSTHPLPEDRVTAMRKRIAAARLPAPTEANLFSAKYELMIKRLPGVRRPKVR